ncbi:MAG: TrmH family RNA methyltransferase [Chloroflexota bacterium]
MKTKIIKIHSENNDYQYIETLGRNRTKRNRAGIFFVEGVQAITQAVDNHWEIDSLVYSRGKRLSNWAEGIIGNVNADRHFVLPIDLIGNLSQKQEPSEIIALVKMPLDDLSRIPVKKNLLIVVLDRPSSPGNLGTVIRSCDAMGVDGLIITGHATDLYDPKTIRATTGSFFCLPMVRLPSHRELIPWLEMVRTQLDGFQVVGSSAKAKIPLFEHDLGLPTVLLVGNETNGLSDNYQALCDSMVAIPMFGSTSSLNVACATSILLYEIARQRGE